MAENCFKHHVTTKEPCIWCRFEAARSIDPICGDCALNESDVKGGRCVICKHNSDDHMYYERRET